MPRRSRADNFPAPGRLSLDHVLGHAPSSLVLPYRRYDDYSTSGTDCTYELCVLLVWKSRARRAAQGQATRTRSSMPPGSCSGKWLRGDLDRRDRGRAGVTKGALYHHFSGQGSASSRRCSRRSSSRSPTRSRPSSSSSTPGRPLSRDAGFGSTPTSTLRCDRSPSPTPAPYSAGTPRGPVETRFSAVALRGALRKAIHAGVIEPQPLRPLALMLTGALSEACLYVAQADDADSAQRRSVRPSSSRSFPVCESGQGTTSRPTASRPTEVGKLAIPSSNKSTSGHIREDRSREDRSKPKPE